MSRKHGPDCVEAAEAVWGSLGFALAGEVVMNTLPPTGRGWGFNI